MKPTILVITPTSDHAALVKEAASRLDLDVIIEMAELEEALKVARRLEKKGVEAVVARGGTARLLNDSNLGIPVISIEGSSYDILKTISRARRHGRSIAVMGSSTLIHGIEEIDGIIDAELIQIPVDGADELPQKWALAMEKQVDCVVGDGLVCRWAEKSSFPAFAIQSGNNAIFTALRRAAQVISVRRLEQVKADRVKAILDNVREAIIGMDGSSRVAVFNRSAEVMFSLNSVDILGKPVASVPSRELQEITGAEAPDSSVRLLNGQHYLVQRIPVTSGGAPSGAIVTIQETAEIQNMEKKIRRALHVKGHIAKTEFSGIIGNSPALGATVKTAQKYATLDSTILISGETGVGKESFAQAIHNASRRSSGPFVAVNCGALPEELLESELFGYVEGAFTGARKQGKTGFFEQAHTGTIFLDEIGHVSPKVQMRLLRVLQEREVVRLGDDRVIPVDVRVIAATNADLANEVRNGRFRADLYYRLNVLSLDIPPLRERHGDIRLLARYFMDRIAQKNQNGPIEFTHDAFGIVEKHAFPGNIRELQNLMEKCAVLCENRSITPELIKSALTEGVLPIPRPRPTEEEPLATSLRDIEQQVVLEVLNRVNGSTSKAAELLNVSRTTIWRKRRGK